MPIWSYNLEQHNNKGSYKYASLSCQVINSFTNELGCCRSVLHNFRAFSAIGIYQAQSTEHLLNHIQPIQLNQPISPAAPPSSSCFSSIGPFNSCPRPSLCNPLLSNPQLILTSFLGEIELNPILYHLLSAPMQLLENTHSCLVGSVNQSLTYSVQNVKVI